MNYNQKIGEFGEKQTIKYLLKRGYIILAKNHREWFYEFDIIAKDPNGIIVFVEVKTKNIAKSNLKNYFSPEDNLTRAKIIKLTKGIGIFIAKYPWIIDDRKGWQIDLIALTIIDRRYLQIRHYENI